MKTVSDWETSEENPIRMAHSHEGGDVRVIVNKSVQIIDIITDVQLVRILGFEVRFKQLDHGWKVGVGELK